ncbi:MAG: DEAD/DEAH box helicase [Fusobacteria bacterium]|nr:DEAD/DEAH box helicase [Fusobacteriota bacterium]
MEKFRELNISEEIIAQLEKKGFEEPTPIQKMCIPALIEGKGDIIGQAQTGTGKTAAFGIPILQNLDKNAKHVQAIILAPTRELVIQITDELSSIKGSIKTSILPVYGGASIERQVNHLRQGVDIVVGTPGRVIDMINRKVLKLDKISYFILDEADEMLNMGFIEDIDLILSSTNQERKILFFSATMPDQVLHIAKKYMKNQTVLKVEANKLTTDLTNQIYFEVEERDKFELLTRMIDLEPEIYAFVFCRTRNEVTEITDRLVDRGYDVDGLHGEIAQRQREIILKRFRGRQLNIIVATDVAARGIDVADLTHVINYSIPQDPESYTHRIGRTGRAGKEGTAVTFITPREYRKLSFIQRATKTDIKKAEIPTIKRLIRIKKVKIKKDIEATLELKGYENYSDIAADLLATHDPQELVSAILKYSLKDELDVERYTEIREVKKQDRDSRDYRDSRDSRGRDSRGSSSRDSRDFRESKDFRESRDRFRDSKDSRDSSRRSPREMGDEILDNHTRLFIAMGRRDNVNKGSLKKIVQRKVNISEDEIKDIAIQNEFSFITLPYAVAEQVVKAFKDETIDGKPVIERAKMRDNDKPRTERKEISDRFEDRKGPRKKY